MIRVNEPTENPEIVTEEEVRIATQTISESVNRVELIVRMWNEIQTLRSLIQKQIY